MHAFFWLNCAVLGFRGCLPCARSFEFDASDLILAVEPGSRERKLPQLAELVLSGFKWDLRDCGCPASRLERLVGILQKFYTVSPTPV